MPILRRDALHVTRSCNGSNYVVLRVANTAKLNQDQLFAHVFQHIADAFPKAKLNVPIGDARRGLYLKWLFFGPSCLEPAITERAYPRKEAPPRAALGFGDFDTVMNVLAQAAGSAKPYLLGEEITAADVVIGSGLRWGTMFKLLPERPEFAAYIARLAERPALKRATEKDAKLQKQQEG